MQIDRFIGPVITYILLLLVTFFTSKDIIKEVDAEKKEDKYFIKRLFLYSLAIPIYLGLIYLLANKFNKFQSTISMSIWMSMNVIYSYSLILTYITDETIKRINRFVLRFCYILNFIGIIYLSKELDSFQATIISQCICMIILVIGLLFSSIGSSDFRCLFIAIPTMIFLYEFAAILPILLTLIIITIDFYIKAKKYGRGNSLPIGTGILLGNILSVIIISCFQ